MSEGLGLAVGDAIVNVLQSATKTKQTAPFDNFALKCETPLECYQQIIDLLSQIEDKTSGHLKTKGSEETQGAQVLVTGVSTVELRSGLAEVVVLCVCTAPLDRTKCSVTIQSSPAEIVEPSDFSLPQDMVAFSAVIPVYESSSTKVACQVQTLTTISGISTLPSHNHSHHHTHHYDTSQKPGLPEPTIDATKEQGPKAFRKPERLPWPPTAWSHSAVFGCLTSNENAWQKACDDSAHQHAQRAQQWTDQPPASPHTEHIEKMLLNMSLDCMVSLINQSHATAQTAAKQ